MNDKNHMYIEDRLFSENRPTEVLYSVMMTEEEVALFSEFQKEFTRWDDTDQLKKMKDSDILAERKKKGTLGNTLAHGVVGAGLGASIGAGVGKALKRGGLKGGIAGAAAGAAFGTAIGALRNHKKQSDINHYNDRLAYAKRQALRRESSDWTTNHTNREGYTY